MSIKDYRIESLVRAFPIEPFNAVAEDSRKREAAVAKETGSYEKLYYPYIQMSHSAFIKDVLPLVKRGMHFIDIGCGGGDKLAVVRFLGPVRVKLTGIEIDPVTAEHATRLCPFANIVTGDAIEESYENYDVLYAYVPISNHELWVKLQNRVVETMKPGATFIVYGGTSKDVSFKWDTPSKEYQSHKTYTKRFNL